MLERRHDGNGGFLRVTRVEGLRQDAAVHVARDRLSGEDEERRREVDDARRGEARAPANAGFRCAEPPGRLRRRAVATRDDGID